MSGAARARRGAGAVGAVAVGAVLLFVGYLRVSWTVAATADGAAQALQARAMLGGNWLLHGWTLSDVSFYTTELPEYVLVEAIRPFGLGVIHVAAALTYTLLVLAVFTLARGRAGGREGMLRGLLAAAIMLAPQLGYGAFVLLLSPDHVGTEVPLLAGWLLLDVAPRRWWGPAILCLLLAVVQFADRVAVLTAVLPLIVVCTVTAARRRPRRPGWFELALVGAGVLSVGVAWGAARALAAAGGFAGHPFPLTLAPLSQLWTHARLTGWGILELYGGNFIGVTGWAGCTLAGLHLIGLTLATVAVAIALVRFVRPGDGETTPRARPASRGRKQSGETLVDAVLAVAVVANMLSYLLSTAPGTVLGTGYDAREIAAVLPLGAVLTGRVFGAALAGAMPSAMPGRVQGAGAGGRPRGAGRWRDGAEPRDRSKISISISFIFFAVIAGYGCAFGYSAARAAAPGQDSPLAGWLLAHGLRYGLGQSSANVITVDSGARVEVVPVAVRSGRVRALLYQSSAAAYDPRLHDASFLVERVPAGGPRGSAVTLPGRAVRATFGRPSRSYRFDGYEVLVWNVNLLTRMGG